MIPNGAIAVPSRRVLLIENSPSDRQLLRTWLASEMIETVEATDIITALSACQKYLPNLVLLQLRLHTWDGFEVIKRLKEDPRTRSIPVIFLAASALTAEKARGIDMGAVDFVSKPFDSVELLARVNSALRTKALLDLLEQRAHLDGLTELGNRFALRDELPRIAGECQTSGQPLSVLIADIDHFKRINDLHGHAAGDEVLRRVAGALRNAVRPGDFLARYGGEEFVAVCPNCDLATALATAERVRASLADERVMFRNALVQMTSSLGVARAFGEFPSDPFELLERADQSLYRAKSASRNAVWYWDDDRRAPAPARPTPSTSPAPESALSFKTEVLVSAAPLPEPPPVATPAPIPRISTGPQSEAPRAAPPASPAALARPGEPAPARPLGVAKAVRPDPATARIGQDPALPPSAQRLCRLTEVRFLDRPPPPPTPSKGTSQ